MKIRYIAMLGVGALCAVSSIHAGEVPSGKQVTVTVKLSLSHHKSVGKGSDVVMDSSDTVVRDETGIFHLGDIPIKHIPITAYSTTRHDPKNPGMMAEISVYKELRARAAQGKTVTLQGTFNLVEPSKAPSWGYRMFFDLANAD